MDINANFILSFESADACLQCMFTSRPKEYIIVNGENSYIEIPTANVNNECFLFDGSKNLAEHYKQEFT